MTEKILYWSSSALAFFALLLLLANTTLISRNQQLQAEVASRQTTIDMFTMLSPLNQNLAQALAQAAVKTHDTSIRELLSSHGIMINDFDKAAAPSTPAAPAAPAEKK